MVPLKTPRTVALCYVRMSMLTKTDSRLAPDRQRAYIEAVCHANGWTPEWFEDVGGHRSGRSDAHRPEWAKLWMRLGDSDIAAVVAYDLARLYRHGERITAFTNMLRMNDIRLVLANPLKSFDTQDDKNHQLFNLISMIDEMYAEDIRESILTSVDYRRSQGMHVGSIPFGTERNAEGYLIPSTQGAWLLPDKTYKAGNESDDMPVGSEWRGFYDALTMMYQLFVDYDYSQEKIARQLNQMGYRYRDRQGQLTLFERDDIRRALSNWPEYGGYRGGGRAWGKERHALDVLPDDYQLNPDLAVLPLTLLKAVGERRQVVSHRVRSVDKISKFALSNVMLCMHCYKLSARTSGQMYLWGREKVSPKAFIYMHNDQPCSVKKRSVQQKLVHKQFLDLVQSLIVDDKTLRHWQANIHPTSGMANIPTQLEREEQQITQALKSLNLMIGSGFIDFVDAKDRLKKLKSEEQRLHKLRQHQSQITGADSQGSDLITMALALREIVEKWNGIEDDERNQLVKRVFEWISYDLDTGEITEFKLVKSAEVYLAALMKQKSGK